MSPLSVDGTVSIPLHDGYNIIANPFEVPLQWDAVRAKNPSIANARIYGYIGSGYDSVATTVMEPFRGYYFFKTASSPSQLRIPYPFTTAGAASSSPSFDWRVQIEYRTPTSIDKLNFVGVARAASVEYDVLENHKPPLMFDHGYVYFARPRWDEQHQYFSEDYRPAIGEGQVWDFETSNPERTPGTIQFVGIDQVPQEYSVVLVNLDNTTPIDLRSSGEMKFTPTSTKSRFKLIVGTREFIANSVTDLVPDKFSLIQNYPNPFNPSTSIGYSIPVASHVRLDVVSILGQVVQTLVNQVQQPARYTVNWDARDESGTGVASGVYFYRLIVDGNRVDVKKMMLIR